MQVELEDLASDLEIVDDEPVEYDDLRGEADNFDQANLLELLGNRACVQYHNLPW